MSTTTHTIVEVTTVCGVTVAHDEYAYVLTPCCGASGKGGADGIICRGCYQPVLDVHGMVGWRAVEVAVTAAGCPCPIDCCDYTLSQLDALVHERA